MHAPLSPIDGVRWGKIIVGVMRSPRIAYEVQGSIVQVPRIQLSCPICPGIVGALAGCALRQFLPCKKSGVRVKGPPRHPLHFPGPRRGEAENIDEVFHFYNASSVWGYTILHCLPHHHGWHFLSLGCLPKNETRSLQLIHIQRDWYGFHIIPKASKSQSTV